MFKRSCGVSLFFPSNFLTPFAFTRFFVCFSFDRCFQSARQTMRENRQAQGVMPVGEKVRLSSEQLNGYMRKFPKSERKVKTYLDPKWTE